MRRDIIPSIYRWDGLDLKELISRKGNNLPNLISNRP
jgi:hypothetical protein